MKNEFVKLAELAKEGRTLEDNGNPVVADTAFGAWVDHVGEWLRSTFPEDGFSVEWFGLSDSPLVKGGRYHDDHFSWSIFSGAIKHRMSWLGQLPTRIKESRPSLPERTQFAANSEGRKEVSLDTRSRAIVDPSRINDLKECSSERFDFSRLVRLCEELNLAYATESYLAVSMLTRSVLDHVPPIFGSKSFLEVSNNYGGTKSFKESMKHLEGSSRKISDHHLHTQIRKSEVLPTAKQVDFSQDLDLLLSEIIRITK